MKKIAVFILLCIVFLSGCADPWDVGYRDGSRMKPKQQNNAEYDDGYFKGLYEYRARTRR